MRGSHQRERRPGHALRWLVGAAGLAVAGASVFAMAPANASPTTVDAQLSLSGVATKSNVLGGEKIGVHPGDTVNFLASAAPTAGLGSVPGLGSLLSALGAVPGQYQVVASFPSGFPGGKRNVTLGGPTSGACKGATHLPVTFANKGNFNFTWTVKYVAAGLLGGCTTNYPSSTELNQLKSAGVAMNASNNWNGTIQVADNPTSGGISIQLPRVSVAPSLPVVGKLPTVGVPGVNLPTISVPKLPGAGGSKPTTRTNSGGYKYKPPALTVPQRVVPNVGSGGGGGGGFGNVGPDGFTGGGAVDNQSGAHATGTAAPSDSATQPATKKPVELSSNRLSGAQMPVLLAIIAIIALSLVTAMYARLYLMRRNG